MFLVFLLTSLQRVAGNLDLSSVILLLCFGLLNSWGGGGGGGGVSGNPLPDEILFSAPSKCRITVLVMTIWEQLTGSDLNSILLRDWLSYSNV